MYEAWERSGAFNPDTQANTNGKSYAILLPPPNITGSLHIGHALNATTSDILIRYHRMRGYKTVWFPGIDHAGIATQNVVEKQLRKEGTSRFEMGREAFITRVWEWKEQYGGIILDQLKRLGASCDWSRTRFTMDPAYADAVKNIFVHYYEKGWLYRGTRVVNWCPRCQTSLSDLEITYQEEQTHLWYIQYPVVGGGVVTVATTRPETMLGDAAVAVHHKDERYTALVGKMIDLPLQHRQIPIIADDAIDMTFGTGAVKVTPAHDLLDAEIGERHSLPSYVVINERARMTADAGAAFENLPVADAREKVVAELQQQGLIEKIEDYTHNVALCYRCATPLQPIPSMQWFLRMEELAGKARAALSAHDTRIIPDNFERTASAWLEHIKDWCVSRQIWWGHQIPVFFCTRTEEREQFAVALEKPTTCPFCSSCSMEQAPDVLDTWFSSALWPFAGLSEQDIKDFYPSHVLITARDIINLWVIRMVFSGLEFKHAIPFPTSLIHATVLTKDGKRMSKSKGTGIDPLELINQYGADATRFGIIWQAMGTQDIRWDATAVQAGQKFITKLWNLVRYAEMKTGGDLQAHAARISTESLEAPDQAILAKLAEVRTLLEQSIETYQFGHALHALYDFLWNDVANGYLEQTKDRTDAALQATFATLILSSLKMLHPFIPFVTEVLYEQVGPKNTLLIQERW